MVWPWHSDKRGHDSALDYLREAHHGTALKIDELEGTIRGLKDQKRSLREENAQLRDQNAQQDAQLKNLIHGQDFRSTRETVGKSHQAFQNGIQEVQVMIKSLVRNSFQQRPVPRFWELSNEALGDLHTQIPWICSPDFASTAQRQVLNVSALDLLEAVIGHMVYAIIIANPLFGCAQDFQANMASAIAARMAQINPRASRSWEAHCLQAYHSMPEFEPFFSGPSEREQILQANCDKVADRVLETIQGLYTFYGQNLPPKDKVIAVLIRSASLACDLGQLESGLAVMDLAWFSNRAGGYYEQWMELKNGSDDDYDDGFDSPPQRKLALVLYPGLLKWGRDNGENWETWSVWGKAKVEMVNETPIPMRPAKRPYEDSNNERYRQGRPMALGSGYVDVPRTYSVGLGQ